MAATLLQKVNRVLGRKLADFQSGLDYVKETRRVMGFVVSSDFKSTDHGRRQRQLKKALTGELSPQEMSRVGPIVTMTPNEASLHEEYAELDTAD
jgi:hypothetical protein